MRLLIVEDDCYLARSIEMALQAQSYSTEVAPDGQQADLALTNNHYDLVVLDLTLPHMDGLEVLRRLRDRRQSTPVLILSARDSIGDRVTGLDNGANDYLIKPFELAEFEARVRALLRKDRWMNQIETRYGKIVFHTNTKEVYVGTDKLDLTARELTLLEILLSNAGKLVTKKELLSRLSERDLELTTNALDIVIHRLRKKICNSSCLIQTMRGIGYTMMDQSATQ